MKLLTNAEQIITCNTNGKNFKQGSEQSQLEVLTSHSIIVEDDLIKDIIPNHSINNTSKFEVFDIKNKIVLPGLVECHTHTAFAGSRADEFKMKLDGIHYAEIAERGGGIIKTVNAVRQTSLTELVELIKPRIDEFISQGITALEIKSGYGLDFENEIKLLHAIKILNEIYPIDIVPTFLGAHTYPKEFKENHDAFIDLLNEKMIPHIAKNNLAEFCDAFCETTAFSADEIDRIFTAASSYGFKIKLHTEQFNNIGGLDVALKHNAISVDHLEVLKESDISKLSNTDVVCVLLPGVSFFLNYQFAPARKLIDSGAIVALSTDFNPGSSHILNLHLIMQLAAIEMKMKVEEIINAVTINAAKSLLRNEAVGSIEIGKKADFSVFDTKEYSDIIYSVGRNLNCMTIKNGEVIYKKN
ncbi:imidazolonepropionase [Ignavibacterium sp.]|uniref:imidazolonepropionase n=1 Tax=Ignavibacterium sp. TaxID=2651167 RepID=UPI00307E0642